MRYYKDGNNLLRKEKHPAGYGHCGGKLLRASERIIKFLASSHEYLGSTGTSIQ